MDNKFWQTFFLIMFIIMFTVATISVFFEYYSSAVLLLYQSGLYYRIHQQIKIDKNYEEFKNEINKLKIKILNLEEHKNENP